MSTESTNQSTDQLAKAIDDTVRHLNSLRINMSAIIVTGSDGHAAELLTEHLHKLLDEQALALARGSRPMFVVGDAPMADAYGESTMQRISDALKEIDHIRKEVRGVRTISALHRHVANPSINRSEGDALAAALDAIEIRAAAVSRLFP